MQHDHFGETFNNICIEEKFENHFFKDCTFNDCYLESTDTVFNSCKFNGCYVFVDDRFLVECEHGNSVFPMLTQ